MRLSNFRRLTVPAAAALALGLSGSAGAVVSGVTIDQATLSPGRTIVTVSGTFACSNGDALLNGQVIQDKAQGFGGAFQSAACDGTTHTYSLTMSGFGGTFHPGRASVQVSVCDYDNCALTDARVVLHSA